MATEMISAAHEQSQRLLDKMGARAKDVVTNCGLPQQEFNEYAKPYNDLSIYLLNYFKEEARRMNAWRQEERILPHRANAILRHSKNVNAFNAAIAIGEEATKNCSAALRIVASLQTLAANKVYAVQGFVHSEDRKGLENEALVAYIAELIQWTRDAVFQLDLLDKRVARYTREVMEQCVVIENQRIAMKTLQLSLHKP